MRYSASVFFGARPLTTFAVNISGAFLIGLLAATTVDAKTRLAFGTGLLGGFTTFSAWQLEAVSVARAEAGDVPGACNSLRQSRHGFRSLLEGYAIGQRLQIALIVHACVHTECDTDGLRRDLRFSPNLYQVGIGVGLVSLSAFFLALILAYSFRIEASGSWQRFHVPSFLWFSTALLGISSWLLEAARMPCAVLWLTLTVDA